MARQIYKGSGENHAKTMTRQTLKRRPPHFNKLYEQMAKVKTEWQNTFDSISDLIFLLDKNARITRVNKAFRDKLNRPYESIIGSYCHEVMHGSASPPQTCPLRELIETGMPASREAETRIGDAVFGITIYPYFDSAGVMQGTIHIYRNITDQNQLKERLLQTEKMAAIGTLAAELAHEINNPLDYIGNYLYLLSESLPPDFPHRHYISKIETGIENLTALTRDLLDFSRPQFEAFEPVDMHSAIDAAIEFSAKNLEQKGIEAVKKYGCMDRKVNGSKRMIQQVFLNLINNSIDAMPDGGKIIISTWCDNANFTTEFTDTGAGIPDQLLHRIFEPFFTTKKGSEKRGTGLGLSICYNMIHRHNGEIFATSKPGHGAAFTVTMPLGEL